MAKILSREEKEALKVEHNCKHIYTLTGEDGKVVYCKDPFSVMSLAKLLFTALISTTEEYAEAFLKNCAVAGDVEVGQDPEWASGCADQIRELLDMPKATITKKGSNSYIIESEGVQVNVRGIDRNDIIMSEKKDKGREPFGANKHLLGMICSDKDWKSLEETNCRALIGIYGGLDLLKSRKTIRVEKD